MASRMDSAFGALQAYLNKCRREGVAPTKAGAVRHAEAEGSSCKQAICRAWRQRQRDGDLPPDDGPIDPIRFRRIDDQHYEVIACGVYVGDVYRDDRAWSECRWFVAGQAQEVAWGGVGGQTAKASGFRSRRDAAAHLARISSGKITAAMP